MTLAERMQEQSFLVRGVEIALVDEREDPAWRQVYRATGGLADFVRHPRPGQGAAASARSIHFDAVKGDRSEVDVAMQWNSGFAESIHTFANTINTHEGGMHEEGFKKALTNVINRYARAKGPLKEKEDNLLGEDIREGLTAIVAVKLAEPQFEGQTKTKLGNTDMRSFVETTVNDQLMTWLEEHPGECEADRDEGPAGGEGPDRGPAGAGPDATQGPARVLVAARQAGRLPAHRPRGVRDLHRRGRFGGREREAGPRALVPGDPARSAARS